jgi:hypothetical protein
LALANPPHRQPILRHHTHDRNFSMEENSPQHWTATAVSCGTDKLRYMEYYWWHLHHWAQQPVTLLEIGVFQGQSLKMWESLFPNGAIHALDINPECVQYANPPRTTVTIGSQADPAALEQWAASAAAPIDLIVDDGSHIMEHLRISFLHLFPKLRPGGIYVLEDLGTCYWANYGGELRHPLTMIEFLKSLVDNVNYECSNLGNPLAIDHIHFYNNICFVYKKA